MNNTVAYKFEHFILNGLGADFFRICKLKHYYEKLNKNLVMHTHDNWELVPSYENRNWGYFFDSLEMTDSNEIEFVTEDVLKEIENLQIDFKVLSRICVDLFKPTENYKSNVRINNPYAVIHIRRGDKVSGSWAEGSFHEIDEYYDKIKDRFNPSNVFVMSDSPEVAEQAKSMGFMVDLNEIRRDGFVYNHYSTGYNFDDLHDEAFTFFKNMQIFKNAEVLVGSNSSFFFVIGQLLNRKRGISISDNLYYRTI